MRKICLLLFLLVLPSVSFGLSPEYKSSIINEANYLVWKHPHIVYKWDTQGGIHVYDQNWGDCSSTIYAMLHKVGIPVRRVAAKDMEAGKGGWKNTLVKLEDADEADMLWWTWVNPETGTISKRIHGHVGMFLINYKSGLLEVMHNSSSKGLHIEPLKGQLYNDVSSTKRLTIGDKESIKLGPGVTKISPPAK